VIQLYATVTNGAGSSVHLTASVVTTLPGDISSTVLSSLKDATVLAGTDSRLRSVELAMGSITGDAMTNTSNATVFTLTRARANRDEARDISTRMLTQISQAEVDRYAEQAETNAIQAHMSEVLSRISSASALLLNANKGEVSAEMSGKVLEAINRLLTSGAPGDDSTGSSIMDAVDISFGILDMPNATATSTGAGSSRRSLRATSPTLGVSDASIQLAAQLRSTLHLLAPSMLHGAIANEPSITIHRPHVSLSMQRLDDRRYAIGAKTGWHAMTGDDSTVRDMPSVEMEHLYVLPSPWIGHLHGSRSSSRSFADMAVVQYMRGWNLATYGTNASLHLNSSGVGGLFSSVSQILFYDSTSGKRVGYTAANTSDPAMQVGAMVRMDRELNAIQSSLYTPKCSQFDSTQGSWSADATGTSTSMNRTSTSSSKVVLLRMCRSGDLTNALAVTGFDRTFSFTVLDSARTKSSDDFWILLCGLLGAVVVIAAVCGFVGSRRG